MEQGGSRPGQCTDPQAFRDATWVAVSSTRYGLDSLARAVARALGHAGRSEVGSERGLAARHREALRRAREELREALDGLRATQPLDGGGGGLRSALISLGELSGRTTPEDVLSDLRALLHRQVGQRGRRRPGPTDGARKRQPALTHRCRVVF
jgi:tRNA U34 5-carboxymethylaminomethyl modifying GTPase MnmE/TrmE